MEYCIIYFYVLNKQIFKNTYDPEWIDEFIDFTMIFFGVCT